MKPSVALDLKRVSVREVACRFHTSNPRIFGSVLHGTDQEDSDLDLLVDALPGTTLFDLGGLQVELEALLGIPVDLLTPTDLPAKFRAQVLKCSSAQVLKCSSARRSAADMIKNRLSDYLDHMRQAATDACTFVDGLIG